MQAELQQGKGKAVDFIMGVCKALQEAGADFSPRPFQMRNENATQTLTYLQAAVINGALPLLKFVFTQGGVNVDIRFPTASKSTYLCMAAQFCQLEVLKLLLELGADPTLETADLGPGSRPDTALSTLRKQEEGRSMPAFMAALGASAGKRKECIRVLEEALKARGVGAEFAGPPHTRHEQDTRFSKINLKTAKVADLSKAANAGDPAAALALYSKYKEGNHGEDEGEAMRWLKMAAGAGYHQAQFNLAVELEGKGAAAAMDWYRKAGGSWATPRRSTMWASSTRTARGWTGTCGWLPAGSKRRRGRGTPWHSRPSSTQPCRRTCRELPYPVLPCPAGRSGAACKSHGCSERYLMVRS